MQLTGGFIRRVLLLVLMVAVRPLDAAETAEVAEQAPLSSQQIQVLIERLEDEAQRKQLIESLRTLAAVDAQQAEPHDSVKSAAADALTAVSERIAELAGSASLLLGHLRDLPNTLVQWATALRDPAVRARWLRIIGRLFVVLAAGFAAAALIAWPIRRARRRGDRQPVPGLVRRLVHLLGRLLLDILPIAAFAVAAYGVLTVIDPRQETRLVALALINASIISRLVLAVSAFLFAPDASHLRLWETSDETANYVHHWVKRLALISIYGFFTLQAALLLGLKGAVYQLLLHLLGAVVVALLLVLIAQNRQKIGDAIAGSREGEQPRPLAPLRRGFARIWHVVASLYLVVIFGVWAMQVEHGAVFVLKATLVSLAVIALSVLLFRASDRVFGTGLRLSDELRNSLPGLEARLNRYFPILQWLLKGVIAVVAVLLIADAWGIDALSWFAEGSGKVLIGATLNILLILGIAIVLWELSSGAIERFLASNDPDTGASRSPRVRTLLAVGRNALLVILTVVSTLMVLSELGINIAPLLAGAGVVGLAIGFGAQRLVQDVITGVFILFQDLMAVGDVVKLGDKGGVVEALSIRTVRLRDLSGTVHTIPFSAIEGVSNLTRDYSCHVFEIGIAYREDVASVIELIKQIGEELRQEPEIGETVLEPVEVFGLDALGDSAVVIKGRIKVQPGKQWAAGRTFYRLVKQRFDEQGIEIPFPHQTIYFGQDKDGSAPPAFVHLAGMPQPAGNEGST